MQPPLHTGVLLLEDRRDLALFVEIGEELRVAEQAGERRRVLDRKRPVPKRSSKRAK